MCCRMTRAPSLKGGETPLLSSCCATWPRCAPETDEGVVAVRDVARHGAGGRGEGSGNLDPPGDPTTGDLIATARNVVGDGVAPAGEQSPADRGRRATG